MIQRKLIALNNKGTRVVHLFLPCAQKNCIHASDYPASERMKFVCAVNIFASGTVHACRFRAHLDNIAKSERHVL